MSKISVLGLYQHDQSLFDELHLPAAFSTNDRATLINNLLMDCAEFECVFPNFDFCKAAIGFWSAARVGVWEKLYATTQFVYNPIWNKDGTITETRSKEYSGESGKASEITRQDTTDKTVESSNAGESSKTASSSKEIDNARTDSTDTSSSSSGDQDVDTENKVVGFNSSSYVNKDKQTVDQSWSENVSELVDRTITDAGSETGSLTESGTTSDTGTVTESGTVTGSDTTTESGTTTGTESEEYVRTEQGNIGITSTQQLIKEEREIALFEIDDYIINDFKRQFCILVY